MTTVRNWALAGALAVSLTGCGGRAGYAPVSGVVTLNGKPYRNGVVMFLPAATKDNPTPSRGSTGYTNENGRFTLKSVDGDVGAAIGKHHVRIATRYSKELNGYEVWDADSNKAVTAGVDPIPPEWNSKTTKEFDVPRGGTDKANFDIVTVRTLKRP